MEENKTVDNIGNLVISEDVIASIALNAAKDVEGVSSFAARTPDVHSIFKLGEGAAKSVRVLSSDNDVKIYTMSISHPELKFRRSRRIFRRMSRTPSRA